MIGDIINVQDKHYETARQILALLQPRLSPGKTTIGVGGESGSGKSVTAYCLAAELKTAGHKVSILHLDDYFILPPQSNHRRRISDLAHVGSAEVNLALLQEHVNGFKAGATQLVKPLSRYHEDSIGEETLSLEGVDILVVEGVYSLMLNNLDHMIFMQRNYLQTKQQRLERNRDPNDAFIEQVLAIEHQIIAPLAAKAQIWVGQNYDVLHNPDMI